MTAPDFDPQRLTIEELLGGQRYYEIPRFQRPYSWDRSNWDDFWRDVFEDNEEGYFIGPMVGFRRGRSGPAVAVVDGQQRLTTITLLLAVIRDCLAEAGEASLAEGIHRFIERPDRDNLARFVIQPEERSAYLNEGILQQRPDRTSSPKVQGDHGLRAAFGDLKSKVEDNLKGPRGGSLTRAARTAKLKLLRDRLLSLRVIWIDHANEDDAYVVFETLNSRGKDLETVDLLKNLLLSKLRTSNRQADTARSKWNAFRSVLQESSPSIPADRFILHWWLSREKYVGQKQLYRRIKEQVRTEKEAERHLAQLGADVRLYRVIFEPTVRAWGPEESSIRESLEALAIFAVVQPAPLLLAMLRCRDEGKPRLGQLGLTFRAIENFHFQSTAVAGQSSSGGISERYAKYAREIASSRSAQARTLKLKEFREAMASPMAISSNLRSGVKRSGGYERVSFETVTVSARPSSRIRRTPFSTASGVRQRKHHARVWPTDSSR